MDDDLLPDLGDLVLSMLIGYAGALEFLYVVRHLYHWSCGHAAAQENDPEGLKRFQQRMRNELATAEALENSTGLKAMQDGVLYKDGIRIDPQQTDVDKLKDQQRTQELTEQRRKEIEAELKRQKEIEEQTRRELERAEAELARQRREAEAAEERQRAEEEAKARKQQVLDEQREVAENARKLLEAERRREEEQQREELQKEAEENTRRLLEAERECEAEERRKEAVENGERQRLEEEARRREEEAAEEERQRVAQEAAENERKLLEAERQREEAERQREEEELRLAEEEAKKIAATTEQEAAENVEKLLEAERENEAEQRQREVEEAELVTKRYAVDAEENAPAQKEIDEQAVIESIQKYLDAEAERELQRQQLIEENARKFLEADQEMEELQQRLEQTPHQKERLSATESEPQTPVYEPPCVKKIVTDHWSSPDEEPEERVTQTVKTQFGQVDNEPYSLTSKPLLFTSISDDTSSIEPQSSFSAHQSDEFATGTDNTSNTIDAHFSQLEREEPEGEDNDNMPTTQYSDDYLRSLDGIKSRPLMREDGSGRRRAFKKRRSSGSSNSSRDSRASREEEVKMFTSLEEEELQAGKVGEGDFTPIKYTSEPTLKIKSLRRRHKRSPAKDMLKPTTDNSVGGSLEMLDEENTNPWGELTPEHYKEMEFWKREKAISIDEEENDLERPSVQHDVGEDVGAKIVPKTSSFEEATHTENEAAMSALQQQTKEERAGEEAQLVQDATARSDTKPNLQSSHKTEGRASAGRSSASPRLRRSPRVDEMDQYEERWNAETAAVAAGSTVTPETPQTPSISIHTPTDTAPWRDQYGLMMEGLSDFYDFTASVNPSRSRATSRQPSPASSQPSSPLPKNVANSETDGEDGIVDVYDDTGKVGAGEFRRENIIGFIEELASSSGETVEGVTEMEFGAENSQQFSGKLENVADTAVRKPDADAEAEGAPEIQMLVQTLRAERGTSRSRSRSPLPTTDNLVKSLENRRHKLIKQNDELLEKLQAPAEGAAVESRGVRSPLTLDVQAANEYQSWTSSSTPEEKYSAENVNQFSDSSHSERSKSRSRSRSPLHTPDNIERRQKLVQHNDELFDKLHVHSPVEIEIQPAEDDPPRGNPYSPEEEFSRENMNLLVEKLRNDRSRSRSRSQSRSPLPTADNIERGLEKRRKKLIQHNDELLEKLRVDSPIEIEIQLAEDIQTADEECAKENMNLLVETLRTKRSRSRSRSHSPLPTADNIQRSLETRRHKMIQHNDAVFEQLAGAMSPTQMNAPTISVECAEDTCTAQSEEVECSRENMSSLVAALLMQRSRSTSKSPMRFMERGRTPEPSSYAADIQQDRCEEREQRSRTPSRSQSNSPSRQEAVGSPADEEVITNITDCYDFHTMLNLEASQNKTLVKCSEEMESVLVEKQRLLDQEALHKLNTASEEVELRTLTPVIVDALENEANDKLGDMPLTERMRQLRCSPTTPDYDRSISAEWRDVQRIKSEMISSGFKRSTYVGESMDLGSEFKPLREATARFRRSQSPSPSSYLEGDKDAAVQNAAEKREVQAQILAELFSASDSVADENRLGAKPKAERESVDLSGQYEEMRRINAEFQRSRSQSRSPLGEMETAELAGIEMEAVRREFQDKVLDEIEMSSVNFQEFSRHLNPDFLDTDRRASDSVLIQKPELLIQLQDMDADLEMDPEDYHHFRRFSLNQEQSVEEYPSDDYIYVSQIEVQTPTGTRTWIREDYYSENLEQLNLLAAESQIAANVSMEEALVEKVEQDQEQGQQAREEEESDGSEDERQTVVEVEDEIDEDICDFNERGPADESHHEQSECEEAEREMDRYAGRGAEDWQEVEDINELLVDNEAALDEGAVGGASPGVGYDSDSCAIDEIYDEAIKNRKQSGILRDYDSLLKEMQNNYMEREHGGETTDSDRYAIWAKTRALKKHKVSRQNGNESPTAMFIENERNDAELRYLGDANVHARQSTRLRSRYGYVPLLHSNAVDDVEVDLNYKPKKEYNWRKNFKLDEDGQNGADGANNNGAEPEESAVASGQQLLDFRKYSLGGESITLFSQSPEKVRNENNDGAYNREEDTAKAIQDAVANEVGENVEKTKKKKGKKKLRKASKNGTQNHSKDADDSESQMYSRRSSSIQMDTDSPKRKSRSRRSSKSSLTNDDPTLLSPRSSIVIAEPFDNIQAEFGTAAGTTTNLTTKKKTKKRKKTKEAFAAEPDIKEEYANEQSKKYLALDLGQKVDTISAIITPETASINLLAALSPQNSVCATPGSIESECSEQTARAVETTTAKTPATATPSSTIPTPPPAVTVVTRTATTSTTTTRTTVDTFDILKDANFYPLF